MSKMANLGANFPWLFAEKSTTGDLEFLGEGSARTRAEQAWVLAAETLIIKTHEIGHCEKLGNHLALNRMIYRVAGSIEFLTPDQDRYQMVCQAANDSVGSYSIVGTIIKEVINQNPVYRGLPRITNNTAHYRTQWRPVNNGSNWREGELDCAGRHLASIAKCDRRYRSFPASGLGITQIVPYRICYWRGSHAWVLPLLWPDGCIGDY